MGDEWPMFRGSLDHLGTVVTVPLSGHGSLWNKTIGGDVESSPAVVGGRLFVGSDDGNIYYLNSITGKRIWNYNTSSNVESSPAVSSGFVYTGNNLGDVCCLDTANGALEWSRTIAGQVYSSPAVSDDRVCVGNTGGDIYCFNATTGAVLWSFVTDDQVWASPAVSGTRLIVGSDDGCLYCVNLTTGQQLWNFNTTYHDVYWSSASIGNGAVYVGCDDDSLYCLNETSGSVIWTYYFLYYGWSSPAVDYGRVYIGGGGHEFYCLNATTGDVDWNFTTGYSIYSSPAVADGIVYFGCGDNNLYYLNASTGALVWSFYIGSAVDSSPAIAGGRVYVGDGNGMILCFSMIYVPPPPVPGQMLIIMLSAYIGLLGLACFYAAARILFKMRIRAISLVQGGQAGNLAAPDDGSSIQTFRWPVSPAKEALIEGIGSEILGIVMIASLFAVIVVIDQRVYAASAGLAPIVFTSLYGGSGLVMLGVIRLRAEKKALGITGNLIGVIALGLGFYTSGLVDQLGIYPLGAVVILFAIDGAVLPILFFWALIPHAVAAIKDYRRQKLERLEASVTIEEEMIGVRRGGRAVTIAGLVASIPFAGIGAYFLLAINHTAPYISLLLGFALLFLGLIIGMIAFWWVRQETERMGKRGAPVEAELARLRMIGKVTLVGDLALAILCIAFGVGGFVLSVVQRAIGDFFPGISLMVLGLFFGITTLAWGRKNVPAMLLSMRFVPVPNSKARTVVKSVGCIIGIMVTGVVILLGAFLLQLWLFH